MVRYFKKLFVRLKFLLIQKKDENGVVYLWRRRGSKNLVIVFSGIGPAGFNYVKALKDCPVDQLFIKDSWAGGVSYYWFENKDNHPEKFTQALIRRIITEGKYDKIFTAGSSKGGSAALYFGFLNNADLIFAGACQYFVGSYLAYHQHKEHPEQWQNVVGGELDTGWVDILDKKIPDIISRKANCRTIVRLLYSTEEHTYNDHIISLIEDLEKFNIQHTDQIEKFPQHSCIGQYFKEAIRDYFNQSL